MSLLNVKKRLRWRLKGCPRCKGDLGYDIYSIGWTCLQCGYIKYVEWKDNSSIKNSSFK